MMDQLTKLSFSSLFSLCLMAGSLEAQSLKPRKPMAPEPLHAVPITTAMQAGSPLPMAHRLVLKFSDAARVRAQADGALLSLSAWDLSPLLDLASRYGLQFHPLIDMPVEKLARLEQRAAVRSGHAQPDLGGMLRVEFPTDAGKLQPQLLEQVGSQLQALASVEIAYIQVTGTPPPDDIAPPTPALEGSQGFLGVNPGINSREANARGFLGSGIRISDCEYGWNGAHEEFNEFSLHPEAGQTPNPGVITNGFDSHGTAVAGIIKAPHNGYGVDSIAPDCEIYTYSEWTVQEGFRRVACITNAVADSNLGDIVLLEMQAFGPNNQLAPAELDPLVYTVCEVARDAGVVVVAAAGNGGTNLNGAAYAPYRARGNSQAIIVGAGTNNSSHTALSFSSYGARVDIQAWGQSVTTTGYGGLGAFGGDKNQRYTASFSGTSSASAIVSAAVVLLQEAAIQTYASPLDSITLRRLMRSTGHPQGVGHGVGPAINLEAALDRLPDLALISSRNGSGANPEIYTSIDFPVVGGLWDSSIDTSSLPGSSSTIIFANLDSSPPVSTGFGEILIGQVQPHLGMDSAPVIGGASDHSIFIPNLPSLFGLDVFTQSLVLGNGLQVTNAIDLTIGL